MALNSEAADSEPPCVIAAYDADLSKAAEDCFDRDSGNPVPAGMLRSYLQALAQHHLRPEAKFLRANFLDSGLVERRHVKVGGVEYIGKEANRWEEQSHLGIDPEAEVAYGIAPADRQSELARLKSAAEAYGLSVLARTAGVSRQHLDAVLSGHASPSARMIARLKAAATKLDLTKDADAEEARALFERIKAIGVRRCAALAGIDAGHLARLISDKRELTGLMRQKLKERSDRPRYVAPRVRAGNTRLVSARPAFPGLYQLLSY